ncbi:MAG: TrkA C-terminal domain-containing protein [Pseudomonadota bacterium]
MNDAFGRAHRSVRCLGVIRGGDMTEDGGSRPLEAGDRVLLFGAREDLQSLVHSL